MEGRGLASAVQQVRDDLIELSRLSVATWLPFNVVIYGVVPLRLRLPAAMMVHLIYAIGLALWEVGFLGSRVSPSESSSPVAATLQVGGTGDGLHSDLNTTHSAPQAHSAPPTSDMPPGGI